MPERPNILWLMTDEQRRDSLGCYGSPWAATPCLDRLASEGTVLENAVTPAPLCVPARASILTGRYPSETGVWWNEAHGRELPHLTDVFHAAGYRSASFGKQHYLSPNRAFQIERQLVLSDEVHYFGYDEKYDEEAHGVVKYPVDKPLFPWVFAGRFPADPQKTSEAQSVRQAIDWLEGRDAGHPFFLRVSFNGPHTPVAPPAPYDTMIDPEAIDLPPEADALPEGAPMWQRQWLSEYAGASRLSADDIRAMRRAYYGEAAFVDTQFARLLDWMRPRGLLDNTIVAFVSDHGAHLGDYGLVQKQTFYEPVATVPCFLWAPGRVAGGARLKTPLSTAGLLPTLLDLAGLEIPETATVPSWSGAAASGREPDAHPVFSEFTFASFAQYRNERLAMVRDGDWKLSLRRDPRPCDIAMHNLAQDPLERRNLADAPEAAPVRRRLEHALLEHIDSTPRPSSAAPPPA